VVRPVPHDRAGAGRDFQVAQWQGQIVKLNVDENPGTAAKFGIMSIPTLMLFKNGELASRQIGAAPKQKLEQWITASV
jgi:thioredoxin 1